MPHITLTKEQPVYPPQNYLIDNRIDKFGTVPIHAKLFTVKNLKQNKSGFQFFVNFQKDKSSWYTPVSGADIDNPFILVAPGEKVFYYITLSNALDYSTEVSFDLEFE